MPPRGSAEPPGFGGLALLEVGRITKPHGVRGDVLVQLTTDLTQRLAPGSTLSTGRGTLTVRTATSHQDRWIVTFEEILDRTAAESWRGVVLEAEHVDAGPLEPDTFWVHELVGAEVVLGDGTHVGTVAEIEANPASDLLVLDTGALVPVVFITAHEAGRVTIDPPDGLLDET